MTRLLNNLIELFSQEGLFFLMTINQDNEETVEKVFRSAKAAEQALMDAKAAGSLYHWVESH